MSKLKRLSFTLSPAPGCFILNRTLKTGPCRHLWAFLAHPESLYEWEWLWCLLTQFGVTHYPFCVFLIKKLSFSHQEIGLCSSALKKEEFCFLGASYWCANKRNAINCNVSAARIEICTPVYYFIMADFRKRKKISSLYVWIIHISMSIVQIMRKLLWTWTLIYWLWKCKLFVLAPSLLQTTRSIFD